MTETEKNNRLNELRSKNAKLLNAKKILAHMAVICDTGADTVRYMDRNAKLIQNVSEHFTIPYYNEMFDSFSDYESGGSYSAEIAAATASCKAAIDSAGATLDNKIEEIAKEVERVKNIVPENNYC